MSSPAPKEGLLAGILILDDVMSAVDTQTEARILDGLRPVLRGRTSIVVSHRVTALRNADRILVLEGGRITQQGTHEELVGAPGYFIGMMVYQQQGTAGNLPLAAAFSVVPIVLIGLYLMLAKRLGAFDAL